MRTLKILLTGLCLSAALAQANTANLDGIAAIVNESIITRSELIDQMQMIETRMSREGVSLPDVATFQKQVLDHMILNTIQNQLAKRTGIIIDDATLDNAIQNMAQHNQMTVTELREALTQDQIPFEAYRENIRQQIAISQLQQRDVMYDIHISEQEISQFMQSTDGVGGLNTEYRLGHILIGLPEAPTPEEIDAANIKAQALIERLNEGTDFAAVALEASQGETALKGGDLGYRKLPEIPTIFVKLVPTLTVDQVAQPIRSASGFHIVKLLDKRQDAAQEKAQQMTQARHILIPTNASTAEQDAIQKLQDLRQQLLQGADFAKLAKTHSADLASAEQGGSLGWVTNDMLVPEFSEAMDRLSPEEISEPFKTAFGWHIVQVTDRKAQHQDENAHRNQAKELIRQRKAEEKLQAWTRQIRDESYVKLSEDA